MPVSGMLVLGLALRTINNGLGLGLIGQVLGLGLASFGLGTTSQEEPWSLLGTVKYINQQLLVSRQVPTLPILRSNCWDHLDKINRPEFDPDMLPLSKLYELEQFALLRPLFQRILCVPASSAPVERIFFPQWTYYASKPFAHV